MNPIASRIVSQGGCRLRNLALVVALMYLTGTTPYTEATWKSSDTSVATVACEAGSNIARIETSAYGQTEIIATSKDEDVEVKCTLEVVDVTEFLTSGYSLAFGEYNGDQYLTGTLSSPMLKNGSTQSVEIISLCIQTYIEGLLNIIHYVKDFSSEPMVVNANDSYSFDEDIEIDSWYSPRILWTIKWNDTTYQITQKLL